MFHDYFVYQGKTYKSGTIITMKIAHPLTHDISEKKMVFSSVSGDTVYGCKDVIAKKTYFFSEDDFFKNLVEVTDIVQQEYIEIAEAKQMRIEKYNRKPTFKEQMDIPGLCLAFVWYIIVMFVAVIFNDRVGIWLIASLIFFSYRNNKLRKAGYKS